MPTCLLKADCQRDRQKKDSREVADQDDGCDPLGFLMVALGKKVLTIERDFNTRAGFTAQHDRLPEFFKKEPLAPHNVTFEVKDEDLDEVFNW